jgi:CubicO group peptidase (beta-lactamase class C family)
MKYFMPKQDQLPGSTSETQGISSAAIDAVVKSDIELHSLMFLRHGYGVAEGWWSPYTPDRMHPLYSLSKSFTLTAVGIAVEEGVFSLDGLVLSFFLE